jgi:hypothetical protein
VHEPSPYRADPADYFVNRRKPPKKSKKIDKTLQGMLDAEERRRNAGENRAREQIEAEEEAKKHGKITFKYC